MSFLCLASIFPKAVLLWSNTAFWIDEMSPTFWDEVTHLGWLHLNHSTQQTLERLGEWYLPIIDVAVQSYALGLVGTEESTFSLVSQKRVVDWNDGIIRSVNVASGT